MEQLGINIPTIIFQVLNFFVLMYVLNKLLYQPMLNLLDARKKKAEQITENEEKLNNRIKSFDAETAIIIKQAKDEAKDIIKKAHESSKQILEKSEIEAKRKAEEIRQKAKEDAEMQLSKAFADLENEISKAAMQISEKLIEAELTDKQKSYILQNSVGLLNENE